MASWKVLLFLAALLLSVSAHPNVGVHIDSIRLLDSAEDFSIKGVEEDTIHEIDFDDIEDMTTSARAPSEKAVFAVKKTEAGFARTTNIGITVQKGTSGRIWFRIRAKAVTTEVLAAKAKFFKKTLTKEQQKQLTVLEDDYDGGYDVPWLKFLGIDLKKGTSRKDLIKARRKILSYDALAVKAKKLLKETLAQKIEVRGHLTAKGVSFIPTTVFSFLRIAKVYFEDGSKLLVLSDHNSNAVAATAGGEVVPSSDKDVEILPIIPLA